MGDQSLEKNNRNDFRDLDVWKYCQSIRQQIWQLCQGFPKEEAWRLADQMIRASRSPGANIAEGYGRFHFQENIQFCRQARGSLYELIDHLVVANECRYAEASVTEKMIADIKKAIHILNGYIQFLKKKKETWKAEE